MRSVAIVGAGMTRFAKYQDRGLKWLANEAVTEALQSAGTDKKALQVAVVGNAAAGLLTGQECVRGQVMLREMGIDKIPIINTENACASSSTAFQVAWLYVASGMYDVALALGVEKMYSEDKGRTMAAFGSAVDVEQLKELTQRLKPPSEEKAGAESGAGKSRSLFMDLYAAGARAHMARYGTTKEQFARIAVKNHYHGSLNPHAQYREVYSLEEILASPLISEPLTRLMCSPIGDGAAAAILVSEEKARQFTTKPVWVRGSSLVTGSDTQAEDGMGESARAAQRAFEMAGLTPRDVNVLELHDATAPAELMLYEELGLCGEGEGGRLIDEGVTGLGGRLPVNTSGGLLAKGHPIGATGVAQIYEIWTQLRGEAGDRQVQGAKVGMTENGGGMVRGEAAATCVHILAI
ncbi:MAG: thiolase [Chloroflexi bacterium RBG_16_68_14]|nr:MAG: thiolase [Chloroflexi bacterium RBG_16_68_14]